MSSLYRNLPKLDAMPFLTLPRHDVFSLGYIMPTLGMMSKMSLYYIFTTLDMMPFLYATLCLPYT